MKVRWIIAGSLISFAMTFVLVFIIAVASYSTDLSEGAAGVCAYAAAALGVFFRSLHIGNKIKGARIASCDVRERRICSGYCCSINCC